MRWPSRLSKCAQIFNICRRWRRSVEQAQSYTFKAVISYRHRFVGAVWLGIKATLGK